VVRSVFRSFRSHTDVGQGPVYPDGSFTSIYGQSANKLSLGAFLAVQSAC